MSTATATWWSTRQQGAAGLVKARLRPPMDTRSSSAASQEYTFNSGDPMTSTPMEYGNTVRTRLLTREVRVRKPGQSADRFRMAASGTTASRRPSSSSSCLFFGRRVPVSQSARYHHQLQSGYDRLRHPQRVAFRRAPSQNTVTISAMARSQIMSSRSEHQGSPDAGYKMTIPGDRLA